MNPDKIYVTEHARRAAEVALAGDHPIVFIGRWESGARDLVTWMREQKPCLRANFITPCPCGCWSSEVKECTCSLEMVGDWHASNFGERNMYDIYLEVPDDNPNQVLDFLVGRKRFEPEESILARIENMTHHDDLSIDDAGEALLKAAIRQLNIPARTAQRVLLVARTIANLAHAEKIHTAHLAEAIQYRPGEAYR
jgi:hypothetical protein